MQTRALGNDTVGRVEVGAVGLGLMTFDQTGHQPREQLLDTVRAALDAGVTLFDTADAYGPGQELGPDAQGENEKLIASILDELGVRDRVLLATKGGAFRTQGGGWDHDGRPEHLHRAVDASLSRLGVEQIALWQHHRQIRTAREALGDSLVSVQNQFSPKFRSSRPEIEVCTELGLAFLPWSPLGGLSDAKELATHHPAFQQVAEAHGVSAQQVALAWELAQSPVVIPIPGAKRPQSILDSAAAADLELAPDELTALDQD
jgi:aryl-alcohol dehydrogenase-like predicted oxidoreductase